MRATLTLFPAEILDEIALLTGDPRALLALARACETMFKFLSDPRRDYIWEQIRLDFKPLPIPAPGPGMNEIQNMSFIFDGGKCEVGFPSLRPLCNIDRFLEVCFKKTRKEFLSFALQLRVCGRVRHIPFISPDLH